MRSNLVVVGWTSSHDELKVYLSSSSRLSGSNWLQYECEWMSETCDVVFILQLKFKHTLLTCFNSFSTTSSVMWFSFCIALLRCNFFSFFLDPWHEKTRLHHLYYLHYSYCLPLMPVCLPFAVLHVRGHLALSLTCIIHDHSHQTTRILPVLVEAYLW
jgi:hypothetical protein